MHRRELVAAFEYDFAPDDAPLLARHLWAIARVQLVDDITGAALAVPFRARIVPPGPRDEVAQDGRRVRRTEGAITINTGADGTFALVARPWLRFTPFAPPTPVSVAVEADGYEPLRYTVPALAYDQRTVAGPAPAAGDRTLTLNSTAGLTPNQTLLFGPGASPDYQRIRTVGPGNQVTLLAGLQQPHAVGDVVFPDALTAPAVVVLPLRRAPVRMSGRVVNRNTTTNVTTAVVGASITVTDFWRTRGAVQASPANGAMTDPTPASRQFAVSVTPGALAQRLAGANVGPIALPPAAGDDRVLVRPAQRDETRLDVASRQNLSAPPAPLANRLLLVEPQDPAISEYHTIAALTPVGAVDEPARLDTELALRRSHPADAPVSRIGVGPLPPTPLLLDDATMPGDRCVFLNGLGLLGLGGTVRVRGGGAVDEFQSFERLETVSDGQGYFRLPLIQRMARVALTIDDGAGHVQTITVDPEVGQSEQQVDVAYLVI